MPPRNQRKGKAPPSHVGGSYVTQSPSNVTCMQMVRSSSNRRSKTSITSILVNTIILSF